MKHYELTNETIEHEGKTLYRIKALVDLPHHGVKAGDLGGYVEKYDNLSDSAWVSDNAKVYGDAWVYGDARVSGNARVCGDALVSGYACIVDSKIKKTNDYFVLQGFKYPITITPQVITIGCKTRSRFGKEQWKTVTKEQAIEMGLPENEYDRIKKALVFLRTQVKRQK